MSSPQFVWIEPTGQGRNVFALFRNHLRLDVLPGEALIHLFADTTYLLEVNGRPVHYGPSRFIPSHPEYDTIDLAPYLQAGLNEIRVTANSKGCTNYQSMPSIGGFIAWGEVGGTDLSTPGAWEACAPKAWDPDAEPFSFAQGAVEICDRRLLESRHLHWTPPVPISHQEHWGPFAPRQLPLPCLEFREAERLVLAAPLDHREERLGFAFPGATPSKAARMPFLTHIFSPRDQEVLLGLFWGPNFLNGLPLEAGPYDPKAGQRLNARAHLKKGWNLFYAEPAILQDSWPYQLAWPVEAGLRVQALPDGDPAVAVMRGPVLQLPDYEEHTRSAPVTLGDVDDFPSAWTPVPRTPLCPSPARELAWDVPGTPLPLPAYGVRDFRLPNGPGQDTVLVADLGLEYLGHLSVEVEAPAGTVIDIGYDERLNPNQTLGFYRTNPFTNTADRFITRGGRETIECFHERGGRYVQLAFRQASGPVTVHRLGVRLSTLPAPVEGAFVCSDPVLNWSWPVGVETQVRSMSDGWIDPWRERGLYLGDALVEARATRAFSSDPRLTRYCLRLWARSQKPDGQMLDVVPSHKPEPLLDYTLIWILMLRDHWAATGDSGLVRELWPCVDRIFTSSAYQEKPSGLWDGGRGHIFIDWGTTKEARLGETGVLNAFRIGALEAAGEMASALGLPGAAEYTHRADQVRDCFRRSLWMEKDERFSATRRTDGQLAEGPGYHANVLALLFDIPTPAQRDGVLRYLRSGLDINLQFGPGYMEAYFLYYVLLALYRIGQAGLAEQVMRQHYGQMHKLGAWTFYEAIGRAELGIGSRCHGWAAGNMVAFAEHTLGVRPASPGRTDAVVIAPQSEFLEWARGTVPHPRGPVHVEWRILGDSLDLAVQAPAGVAVDIRPEGRLARLRLRLRGTS